MEKHTELLALAYQYLESKKKSNFNDIWKYIKKELNIQPEAEEKTVGNLYTGMVLDPQFVLKKDKLWYPRNEVSIDEFNSQVILLQDDHDKDDYDASEVLADDDSDDTLSYHDSSEEEDLIPLEDNYDDDDDSSIMDEAINKIVLEEEFED